MAKPLVAPYGAWKSPITAEARVGPLGAPPEDRVEAELRHPRPAGVEESGAGDHVDFVGVGPEPPRSLVGLERRIEGVLLRLDAPLPEVHRGVARLRSEGLLDRALLLVKSGMCLAPRREGQGSPGARAEDESERGPVAAEHFARSFWFRNENAT